MSTLQWISIAFELAAMVLGLMIAVGKRKTYGWGIALTFAIYVFYDLARLISLPVDPTLLAVLFFLASVSILWAIWSIFRELPCRLKRN